MRRSGRVDYGIGSDAYFCRFEYRPRSAPLWAGNVFTKPTVNSPKIEKPPNGLSCHELINNKTKNNKKNINKF